MFESRIPLHYFKGTILRIAILDTGELIGVGIAAALLGRDTVYYPKNIFKTITFDEKNISSPIVTIDRQPIMGKELVQSHAVMENDPIDDDFNEKITPNYFQFGKWQYGFNRMVWANFFGVPTAKKINFFNTVDKFITITTDPLDNVMRYAVISAMKPVDIDYLKFSTQIWIDDHVTMNDHDITQFSKVWHDDFMEMCIKKIESGEIKYWFQTNRLHWNVYEAIRNNQPLSSVHIPTQDDLIKYCNKLYNGPKKPDYAQDTKGSIVLDKYWYKELDLLFDRLEISDQKTIDYMASAAENFRMHYESKREYFDRNILPHLDV